MKLSEYLLEGEKPERLAKIAQENLEKLARVVEPEVQAFLNDFLKKFRSTKNAGYSLTDFRAYQN